MPSSSGMSATLPRSQSEIVVDFARPKQTSEDEMSHDSLNESEFTLRMNPEAPKGASKNALYIDDSDEEVRRSPEWVSQGTKHSVDPHKTRRDSTDWGLGWNESNPSKESIKVVREKQKSRRSAGRDLGWKPSLPTNSPAHSFRSTIDLLPSSKKRRGLRQQVIIAVSSKVTGYLSQC